ncbi:cytochrome B [Chromatium weissei]|nr:cytochrome B [Chromatium weissei]
MNAIYLYPLWVRIWHWFNALLFVIMLWSGASLHFAGSIGLLDFSTARPIHNIAGILLALSWIAFVIGNLVTSNGRHYRVQWHGFIRRLITQGHYYAVGIFNNEPHPFHPSTEMKLNTLQQTSYLAVMYILMPLLILSGGAFLFSIYLPETLWGLGSVWVVAMAHLTVAYCLVLFIMVHLYIITTGETVTTNLRAMVSGWHREMAQEKTE